MSNITVCVRFRPLNSRERRDDNGGGSICIRGSDSENFILKDGKDEEYRFSFDKVFYQGSQQADIYEFLARSIVRDAVRAINGTIITYGQTGAGKTYSLEGANVMDNDAQNNGLLPRVVAELFEELKLCHDKTLYKIKLSMVEIYMERVRDLFDLSKDNIQIKEHKTFGIILEGVTEVSLLDPEEALKALSSGIANRAVGETQMNMSSSRSHCIYIFTIQTQVGIDNRVKAGKLILVDLAGSEKVEKTGAEGKVLEEAKTINKSLSALGNVINALTCGPQGKANHIPYRDSKLTRILQDAIGGASKTALLCCCSPSSSNASETLSTLRFGARQANVNVKPATTVFAQNEKLSSLNSKDLGVIFTMSTQAKHIKSSRQVNCREEMLTSKQHSPFMTNTKLDESRERILKELREKLDAESVKLLEELFVLEGIFFNPTSVEEVEAAFEDLCSRTISSLQEAEKELVKAIEELKEENGILKARLRAAERMDTLRKEVKQNWTSHVIFLLGCFFFLVKLFGYF